MNIADGRKAIEETHNDAGVRQNLLDAKCPQEAIECFMALRSRGNVPEQLAFLAMHRKTLLNRLRQAQHSLDCLDFLIFSIKKQPVTEAEKLRIKE